MSLDMYVYLVWIVCPAAWRRQCPVHSACDSRWQLHYHKSTLCSLASLNRLEAMRMQVLSPRETSCFIRGQIASRSRLASVHEVIAVVASCCIQKTEWPSRPWLHCQFWDIRANQPLANFFSALLMAFFSIAEGLVSFAVSRTVCRVGIASVSM